MIGISGTGKSSLSTKIGQLTGIPVYHMDGLIWKEQWKESSTEEITDSLKQILSADRWIIEGWIDQYSSEALKAATTIIYLDYSGWLAFWRGIKRWWTYRGKQRPEMPAGCNESLNLKYLRTILSRQERPHIEKILAELSLPRLVRCATTTKTEKWLADLRRDFRMDNDSEHLSRHVD